MCASLHQFQIVCINVNYFYHFSIYCLCSRAAWNCICKWYFILLLLDYRNQITFSTRQKKKYSHNSKRKWNRKIDNKMHRKTTELNCLQRDSRRWMDQQQPHRHNRISIHSGKKKEKANHFVLVLFVFFLFIPLMAEKEIVLRVFYQLCSFGCQLCLSLLFNIYLYAEWNVSNKTKKKHNKKTPS